MRLADRVLTLKPSATLSINAKAQKLRQMGLRVINFAVGEPDFETPEHIKRAAIRAMEGGKTRYTPASGIAELKEAVCRWIERYYGLRYQPHDVLVSCGGKHAIFNILQCLLNQGDEVIIPAPYWVSYPAMVTLCSGVPVVVPCSIENDYKITPHALKDAMTEKTKAIIFNSPSNPTGVHYDIDDLNAIADVLAPRRDVFIISDDIYSRIIFHGAQWANLVMANRELMDRTIIIQSVSKTYAMTGWRIGFAVGPDEVINAASKIQSQSTSNPCSIAQWASLEALTGDQECVDKMVKIFEERATYVCNRLDAIDDVSFVRPKGAFYVFPDVSAYYGRAYNSKIISNSTEMANFLLDHARIAVVPGIAFGDDRCIRLSFALSTEELKEGLDRFESALADLR